MSDHDDSGGEEDAHLYKPSFVLIAIDTHASMFVKNEDDSSPFQDALKACYTIADSLVLTQNKSSWSKFGIVIADNDDSRASFVEFQTNFLHSVKFLKHKKDQTNKDLMSKYMRKGAFNLGAFFLLCKKKFKEIKSPFYKRTLIFITNDDKPVQDDAAKRFTALNEAKTFDASDITFQLISMNEKFNYSHFYNELFSLSKTPAVEEICLDEEGLTDKLSSAIKMQYSQKMVYFYPNKNDNSRFLKVIKLDFISTPKLYNNACVSSEDGKELKKIMHVVKDTNQFELNFAGKQILLELHEKIDLFQTDLRIGYTLLFVSKRLTDIGFVINNPSMIQVDPKEELPFFNSFWQYCVDHEKVLVCAKKLRVNDKIRYVELIPKFANNTKMFLIKHIPFANEISYPPTLEIDCSPGKDEEQAVEDLIDALSFDYHPRMFSNPSYGKKKAYVKSKLLDEPLEEAEEVDKDDGMDSRIGDVVRAIKTVFEFDEGTATKKRKAPSTTSRAKKAK